MVERRVGPFQLFVHATRSLGAFVWRVAVWSWLESLLKRAVAAKLGPYKQRVNHIDTLLPKALPDGTKHKVAVIGGGLAGISAASHLAERGFDVTIYEANGELGGKVASWTHTFDDALSVPMEHGFHAFFPNYYNLNRFLQRLGIEQGFRDTTDYRILTRDGGAMSFAGLHRTPGINIVHLALQGFFPVWETVVRNRNVERLNDMLNYHPEHTPERLDGESYAQYAVHAKLPPKMQLIFRSFTRVFFAESEQMSLSELIKSFHGFFLSHDGGLMYRYPADDHATVLWEPIAAHLAELGVTVKLNHRVSDVSRQKNGRLRVAGQPYDDVVLTTDLKTVRTVLAASSELIDTEAPDLRGHIDAIQPANRYANLQLWFDADVRADLPSFTSTERIRALDSITTKHRNEATWQAYTEEHGGSVVELHSYSVPVELDTADKVRQALLDDLMVYCPELLGAKSDREISYIKDDFSAFFVGMHAHRPGVQSGVDGLWFAGDWVALDIPAMLMENAFSSGLVAANAILERHGLQQAPVYSVPREGILYGIR